MGQKINMLGVKTNKLTAIEDLGGGHWLFQCDCGNSIAAHGTQVRREHVRSCGCLQKEAARRTCISRTTHGASVENTPTYRSWRAMIGRVERKDQDPAYSGITICARWRISFANFLEDMGERPEGKSIDRFPDRNGNYEPGNCRWATKSEQQRNQDRYVERHS